MKLIKERENIQYKHRKIYRKNSSEDFNNSYKSQDFFFSKFLQNKSNNNSITKDNITSEDLPELKSNIQNIFANDDKKQRAIQYLLKIRKERNSSSSTDFKKILSSEVSKENIFAKKENENEVTITPYIINNYRYIPNVNEQNILTKNVNQKKNDIKRAYNYRKEGNNFLNIKNNTSVYSTNNIFQNNKKIYNNVFNNKKTQIIKRDSINKNEKKDNLNNGKNNPINKYHNNNSSMNNYAYNNYITNYNNNKKLKIKNQILNSQQKENNKDNIENNNYSMIYNRQMN